jgi:hypothetical protein
MFREILKRIKKLVKNVNYSPLRKGRDRNFIYIHINKTGGTSISKAIGIRYKNHLTVKEVISIVGKEEFDKAFIFTVVRNPWDKVVSHYKYRVKTNQTNMADNHITFKDWVKLTYGKEKDSFYYDKPKMFAPQSEWLMNNDEFLQVNEVIRFESLSDDFKRISDILKIKKKLPHLNATMKDSYTKYYDAETMEIVRDWFKDDIVNFNYEFGK